MTTEQTTQQLRKEHDLELAEARKQRNAAVRREDMERREKMVKQQAVKK